MAERKKIKLKWRWIILPVVVMVLFAFYNFSSNKASQSQQPSNGYLVYQDPTYDFNVRYPQAWEIRKDTQIFENGDAIAFRKTGSTQKEQTELTDGAQVVISKPFSISKDLSTWVREYYDRYSEFSKNTLAGRTYQKVYSCGHSCMTYYYTIQNDKIFGIATFAQGAGKMIYDNAIVYMLKSLQFNSAADGVMSKEDAVAKVKALPEIIDYLKRVPNGLVAVNGEEDNAYLVQVYEFKDGHTATFNWYTVNKSTRKVKKDF